VLAEQQNVTPARPSWSQPVPPGAARARPSPGPTDPDPTSPGGSVPGSRPLRQHREPGRSHAGTSAARRPDRQWCRSAALHRRQAARIRAVAAGNGDRTRGPATPPAATATSRLSSPDAKRRPSGSCPSGRLAAFRRRARPAGRSCSSSGLSGRGTPRPRPGSHGRTGRVAGADRECPRPGDPAPEVHRQPATVLGCLRPGRQAGPPPLPDPWTPLL
jgi:hypothetical protein